MMRNFFERFERTVERVPDHPAVEVQRRDRVDRFTYRQLHSMALAFAAALERQGLAVGDRCALLAGNDAHWCAAYLGILARGCVAVPLDTNYTATQVATLVADCGARAIFTGTSHVAVAYEAVSRGVSGHASLACDVLLLTDTVPAGGTADPGAAAATSLPHGDWRADAPAVILYTSGTTSDPKGVVLSHGNILAEGDGAFAVVSVDERDAVLGVLPLFHALAQMANLLLPFWQGARVVYLEQLNTTELLRALAERDCTAFCCVPQFFYLIHQRVTERVAASGLVTRSLFTTLVGLNGWLRDRAGLNLGRVFFRQVHQALGPRMRLLITGGSRFDPGVARDMHRLGFDIIQAYGLTECSGAATVSRPGMVSLDDVGPPLPGVEVRIAPRTSQPGEPEGPADGEVLIRGPIVMQGYWNRPDVNAVTLRDGWLHTGDLGLVGDDGRLRITGRQKEMIVLSSGKNIYPEEVEAHYLQSPFIKEMCVVGLRREDEPSAERLHAVVVPNHDVMRERRIVNARELIRFELEGLSVKLPPHKRVLGFDVWTEDLPRTTTRKLKRFEIERALDQQAAARRDASAEAQLAPEDVAWASEPDVATLIEVVREVVPHAILSRRANLELDLGLDSMERVELFTVVQHRLGVSIDESVIQRTYTLGDLADAVASAGVTGHAVERRDPWQHVLAQSPQEDAFLKGLEHDKHVMAVLMWMGLRALRAVAWLMAGFRVTGLEHLPRRGPYLICPNHESFLDGFLLVSALPYPLLRSVFFVGATEYFTTPLLAWFARSWNIVPVDADANLVRAMQAGAFGLRRGKILILFPEGERTIDGHVKTFRKGATILATRMGVPIVPAAFEGVFEVWPRSRPFNWRALLPGGRARMRLRFGPAIGVDAWPRTADVVDDDAAASRLRQAVLDLRAGTYASQDSPGLPK